LALLELINVVKHYHTASEEVRAVDGVSLKIEAGEMVALHGPSGSGKSTLLLVIAGLLRPDAGTIRYEGREVNAFSEDEVSNFLMFDVGFVYQNSHLLPRVPAVQNAALKLVLAGVGRRRAEEEAALWLERLGLGARLDFIPEKLSGGERQRVAIARAMTNSPKLILADEPTGNLDTKRSREVIDLLRNYAHGKGAGLLLVTHDMEAAALADRSFELRDGQLRDSQHQFGSPGGASGGRPPSPEPLG